MLMVETTDSSSPSMYRAASLASSPPFQYSIHAQLSIKTVMLVPPERRKLRKGAELARLQPHGIPGEQPNRFRVGLRLLLSLYHVQNLLGLPVQLDRGPRRHTSIALWCHGIYMLRGFALDRRNLTSN